MILNRIISNYIQTQKVFMAPRKEGHLVHLLNNFMPNILGKKPCIFIDLENIMRVMVRLVMSFFFQYPNTHSNIY